MKKALTRTQWWIVALFPLQLALTVWVTLQWGTAHGLAAAALVFIPVYVRLWMLNRAASQRQTRVASIDATLVEQPAEGVLEYAAD